MTEMHTCSRCGAPLAPDQAGQCPQCLLRLGLGELDAPGETHADAALLDAPETIGPYRLVRKLGEGGMGLVYLAEQDAPIRRTVALKLIKLGMDTRQVIARFETERQALAMMNHPHVAAVHDAGATPEGRPYFVMEYVPGLPITEYADRFRLSIAERLGLFVQACDALQHAHQKGLIHRDVKPTNVLVTQGASGATVKVIDFGVAKATTRLSDAPFLTEQGLLIGTPAYMSPEQADPGATDIDQRTDVYSLGVLLYELMVGALPFDPRELMQAGYDEIRRRIREDDPPRPSTRITTLADASDVTARNRRTDLRTLGSQLRGDLDWVVMRALDKDPARRYASPSAFAQDLQRYLRDEPVDARPPNAVYKVRKLVRRHRLAVTAAALVVLALAGGGLAATWQAVRATRAEQAALAEAETARQVSNFLIGLFEGSDPGVAQGETLTARELLERGRARIERELADQPAVRARLLTVLGDIHSKLGLYEAASPLLRDALAAREALDAASVETAETTYVLGRLLYNAGDTAAAGPVLERARDLYTAALGPETVEVARALHDLAEVARAESRLDDSRTLNEQALAIRERVLGPHHPEVAASLNGLGGAFYDAGRYAEAEEAQRRALTIRRAALGHAHPDVAESLGNLASIVGRLGREAEGEPLLVEAVEIFEKVYGPEHRHVASAVNNLGMLYGRQGRLDEAAAAFTRTARIRERVFGPDHAQVSLAYRNLGTARMLAGRFRDAEAHMLRALAIDEASWGPAHVQVIDGYNNLAVLYARLARLDDAEARFRQAHDAAVAGLGDRHPQVVRAVEGLGEIMLARARLAEAERLFRQAHDIQRDQYGPEASQLGRSLEGLGAVALARGRVDDAREMHRQALAVREKGQGPAHPALANTLHHLARAQLALGDLAGADASLARALRITEDAHGPDHFDVATSAHLLGDVRAARGDDAGARAAYDRAWRIRRAVFGDRHPDTRASRARIDSVVVP